MDMLQYLIESGKINPLEISREMDDMKRKEILKQHQFKVWQGSNGKWYTYLPDAKKGRVQKTSKSRQKLEDVICSYYKEKEVDPTLNELFTEWISNKLITEEIEEATATRYRTDYERCCQKFGQKHIRDITEWDIEIFLRTTIKDKNMKRKAFSNLRTLIYGVFRYAKKKELIDYNIKDIVEAIDFSKKSFNADSLPDKKQVFTQEEEDILFHYMEENLDMVNLGIMLLFKTGLRVGELSTLKHCDVDLVKNKVHIGRTETKWTNPKTKEVVCAVREHPKTQAGIRDVYLKESDRWILQKIVSMSNYGEYLFMDATGRYPAAKFRARLRRNCNHCGIEPKSPHKIRKTYGTKLYDSPVERSFLIKQMGHTDISCLEKHYYRDRTTEAEKISAINSIPTL